MNEQVSNIMYEMRSNLDKILEEYYHEDDEVTKSNFRIELDWLFSDTLNNLVAANNMAKKEAYSIGSIICQTVIQKGGDVNDISKDIE